MTSTRSEREPGKATTPDQRGTRRSRFLHAFGLMLASKGLSVVVQLCALPLALMALGTERYAAFLTLQAIVSWFGLAGLGLAPSLPRFIAECVALDDRKGQSELVTGSVVFIVAVASLLALTLIVVGRVAGVGDLISASPKIPAAALDAGYAAVVLLTAGQLVMTVSTALRSGFQELHWSARWTAIGNVAILVLLIAASRQPLSIAGFVVLLYLPVVALLVLDIGILVVQRPYLFTLNVDLRRFFGLVGVHSANAFVMQISFFILVYSPTILVAHVAGPVATAGFASIMQLFILGISGLGLITAPLVPAIANAHSQSDLVWIRRAYLRAAGLLAGSCILAFLLMATVGPFAVHAWLHKDIGIDRALCASMALYFAAVASSVFSFNVLAAMGNIRGIAKAYVIEAVLAQGLGITLLYRFGPAGMACGLAIGIGAVTAWYFPYRVLRSLREGAWEDDAGVAYRSLPSPDLMTETRSSL
jgi:O-antigen/teichoic acid export membrane protein